ncbi:MAG: amidohydrolase family protein [Verrucomicrobia bacterium]|nr:amidohydrolase family protein [Verrucomicrobiota bacterium]MDA1068424.1 amidohydrolase family protein [Verrucomicrobiota bacterium]
MNRFSVAPLSSLTQTLAAVASGTRVPDLVVTGCRILSTYTERMLSDKEVWVSHGRIAAIKPAGTFKGTVKTFDARGGIIAPGLVDPHIHIESSMMTACAYSEAALLNGTTTIFCDSHEIGNVCDTEGIEWMLEDARVAPLNIYLTLPSTIPATNAAFETCGGDLTPEKAGAMFDAWPEIVALGEKMDFVPVCMGDPRSHGVIQAALKRGRPVSGHIYGREFVGAYAASGVTDTHEAIDRDIANDFLEAGIWIFLRGGPPTTPWHSLPEAIKAVTELGASTKRVCVCTDDRDADDLFVFGMNWVVTEAIRAGIDMPTAWSMGSLHPATRYAMDGDFGALGHGRRADMVLLNDDLEVKNTWYGGELVVEDGKVTSELDEQLSNQRYQYPKKAYETVNMPLKPILIPEIPAVPSEVSILRTELPGIVTLHRKANLENLSTSWDSFLEENDCCHMAVIERYGVKGNIAYGFLQNFGLKEGAVASSVGHDAHNVIVAGFDETSMSLAIETIRESQGGVSVVQGGEVVAFVALPIAGLISDLRAGEVAEAASKVKAAWVAAGCTLPYMGFNLLPLSVIPEIRLTDKGLVKVPEMEIEPLFKEL